MRFIYCTVKPTVVECEVAPLDPVIVTVNVPCGAWGFGEIFRVDVPEPTTDDGLKLAFIFFGSPDTLRVTVPEKPAEPAMFTV